MDRTTLILAVVAAILLGIAYWRGQDLPLAGLLAAGKNLWRNLLILLLGFLIAGVVQVLVPKDMIARSLGSQAGFKGILTACVAGGLVPGAPYAVFPLVASFYKAGASLGAVVGFTTAWSLWSLSRLPLEIALIDPKPALIRYGLTFVIPPLAGLLANAVNRML